MVTSELQTFKSPLFRSTVFQMPGSYYYWARKYWTNYQLFRSPFEWQTKIVRYSDHHLNNQPFASLIINTYIHPSVVVLFPASRIYPFLNYTIENIVQNLLKLESMRSCNFSFNCLCLSFISFLVSSLFVVFALKCNQHFYKK